MQPRLDSELIEMGRNGDRDALSELFERYYASSLRTARRILRSDEEARDAVQSSYLSAFTHFASFRGDSQFNTWITQIVRNQCFMALRRPERRTLCTNVEDLEPRFAEAALADRTPTPEQLAWQRQINAGFSEAAGKLPGSLRDIYRLCSLEGFGIGEAAETLGLTEAAAKARLFRAQHRIKPALQRRFVMQPRQTPTDLNEATPTRIAA